MLAKKEGRLQDWGRQSDGEFSLFVMGVWAYGLDRIDLLEKLEGLESISGLFSLPKQGGLGEGLSHKHGGDSRWYNGDHDTPCALSPNG